MKMGVEEGVASAGVPSRPEEQHPPPSVLTLTDEWQVVPEGWAVPPGADIRMDLAADGAERPLVRRMATQQDLAQAHAARRAVRDEVLELARGYAAHIRHRGLRSEVEAEIEQAAASAVTVEEYAEEGGQ